MPGSDAMIVDFDRIAEAITPEQLARAIGAEKIGSGWRCPLTERHSNGDEHPSFSLYRYEGRTLAKCHGCSRFFCGSNLHTEGR